MEIFKSLQNESISFTTEDIDENYTAWFLKMTLHGTAVYMFACMLNLEKFNGFCGCWLTCKMKDLRICLEY